MFEHLSFLMLDEEKNPAAGSRKCKDASVESWCITERSQYDKITGKTG